MPIARVLLLAAGVLLLLLLDIATRRTRYYSAEARPLRAALLGGLGVGLAWLVASYFGRSGLHTQQALEALLIGGLWFVAAATAGLLLRRAAIRAAQRRR